VKPVDKQTEAPQGVRLRYADGTTVECGLARAPDLDRQTRKGTVTYWWAVPVTPVDPALTYTVECDVHPAMTGFKVDTEMAGVPLRAGPVSGLAPLPGLKEPTR
jgi:hypothetical protein